MSKNETLLCRPAAATENYRLASPAVERASTVLFQDLDAFDAAASRRFEIPYYGRYGTTTTFELEELVARLEQADKAYGTASGHAAISATLLAFLSPGDHALFPENVYEPTRHIATGLLRRYGVECDFYPGRIGKTIGSFCKPATRLIWIEAPGSLTYEIPQIDEIVALAQSRGIVTVADNTWASSWLFRPLAVGIDASVVSATKYMSGHSDVFGGFVSIRDRHRKVIEAGLISLGAALSPDAAYLIQRGLRTMPARLKQQVATATQIAQSLASVRGISEIFFPPLPSSSDHARWKAYFSGGNGLLTFALDDVPRSSVARFVKALRHFHLGVSWGGFESLIWPRQDTRPGKRGRWLVRVSAGLESPEDLVPDLHQALASVFGKLAAQPRSR